MILKPDQLSKFKEIQALYFSNKNKSPQNRGYEIACEAARQKEEVQNDLSLSEDEKKELSSTLDATIYLIKSTNEAISANEKKSKKKEPMLKAGIKRSRKHMALSH